MAITFNHKSKGSLVGSGTYRFRHYGVEQSQLSAPVITLSVSTISWSAVPNAVSYALYKDGVYVKETASPLSVLESGTYQVKAIGDGVIYTDSELSNSVTYTVSYTITVSATNISPSASNPETITEGGTATLEFKANTGYKVPTATPTVEYATVVSWTVETVSSTNDTGYLVISTPTNDVTVTIVGEGEWEYPTQSGDELTVTQVYSASQSSANLTIE